LRGAKVILIVLVMFLIQPMITPIYIEALSTADLAYTEGNSAGKLSGQIYGQKDYINGQRSNWQKAYNEEEEIVIDDYNLKQQTASYRSNFLKGFKEGFKLSYENGYRGLNSDTTKTAYGIGLEHGTTFGAMVGEIYGRADYYEGKVNDWQNQMPSELSIRREY